MTDFSNEDWLGLEFGEAMAKARPFRILVTRPGPQSIGIGRMRVVGQRPSPEGLCLIFSYPDFERLPRRDR